MKKFKVYENNDGEKRAYLFFADTEEQLIGIILKEFLFEWLAEDDEHTPEENFKRFLWCRNLTDVTQEIGLFYYELKILEAEEVDGMRADEWQGKEIDGEQYEDI